MRRRKRLHRTVAQHENNDYKMRTTITKNHMSEHFLSCFFALSFWAEPAGSASGTGTRDTSSSILPRWID